MSVTAWKWSYGDPPERSVPANKQDFVPSVQKENNIEVARNPTSQAIEDAETANMAIQTQFLGLEQEQIMRKTSSRDIVNTKLGQREMMPAVGGNPFLGRTDYVRDLQVQSQFLIPQSQYRRDNK
jgi:hypothetical protein